MPTQKVTQKVNVSINIGDKDGKKKKKRSAKKSGAKQNGSKKSGAKLTPQDVFNMRPPASQSTTFQLVMPPNQDSGIYQKLAEKMQLIEGLYNTRMLQQDPIIRSEMTPQAEMIPVASQAETDGNVGIPSYAPTGTGDDTDTIFDNFLNSESQRLSSQIMGEPDKAFGSPQVAEPEMIDNPAFDLSQMQSEIQPAKVKSPESKSARKWIKKDFDNTGSAKRNLEGDFDAVYETKQVKIDNLGKKSNMNPAQMLANQRLKVFNQKFGKPDYNKDRSIAVLTNLAQRKPYIISEYDPKIQKPKNTIVLNDEPTSSQPQTTRRELFKDEKYMDLMFGNYE